MSAPAVAAALAPRIEPFSAPTYRPWTTREVAILRNLLPSAGAVAAAEALPGRSESAVRQYGRKLGLRPPQQREKRPPWTTNEHIDAAIRRTYQTNATVGAVRHLCETLGRPRQWVRKRAEQLGCVVPRFKEPEWTAAEDDLVRAHAAQHIDVIARKLRAAGYRRTACGVRSRLSALDGIDRSRPGIDTAAEIARCMGVDSKTVVEWIRKGLLIANRRKTECPRYYNDVIWEIRRKNIRKFIVENVAMVDLRKADKFWLVELLANGGRM